MNELQAIELELRGEEPWEVLHFHSVGSTMDEARARIAELHRGNWLLVVADTQSAGRGRQGRGWSSESGGMYATIGFATARPVGACSGLSLMVGVVACEVLAALGATLRLKWPNDLLDADGRKVGGILIEVAQHAEGAIVLVGIGLNVANPIALGEENRLYAPGHLAVFAPYDTEPFRLAPLIARELRRCWHSFEREGLAPFVEPWKRLCSHIDSTIEVQTDQGMRRGRCCGVDSDGALLLEDNGRITRVVSGHVSSLG